MDGMTITEFILARVAEGEEAAMAAYPSPWRAGGSPGGHVWTGNDSGDPEEGPTVYVNGGIYANQRKTAEHIARVADPERVLADCKAVRTIVEQFEGWDGLVYDGWTQAASLVLSEFAAIWADHPDYREEWP